MNWCLWLRIKPCEFMSAHCRYDSLIHSESQSRFACDNHVEFAHIFEFSESHLHIREWYLRIRYDCWMRLADCDSGWISESYLWIRSYLRIHRIISADSANQICEFADSFGIAKYADLRIMSVAANNVVCIFINVRRCVRRCDYELRVRGCDSRANRVMRE